MAAIDEILQLVARRQPLSLLQQDVYLDWLKKTDNAAARISELEQKYQEQSGVIGSIVPIGQTRITKVSQIANDLGDMIAGRHIAPSSTATSTEPTNAGFTGSFMSGDGETFGGVKYGTGGVNAGVLQWGGSNEDGTLLAGAGDIVLSRDGILLTKGTSAIGTEDPAMIRWKEGSDLTAYIESTESAGAATEYLRLYKKRKASEALTFSVLDLWFDNLDSGYTGLITFSGTATNTAIDVTLAGDGYISLYKDASTQTITLNDGGNDIDAVIEGATDANLVTVDAGLDAVGIGGAADASYKLKVTGDFYASNVLSGTYTPTGTAVANVDSVTTFESQYMRIGNVVSVSGLVNVDCTTAGVVGQIRLTLPIASNLGANGDCSGNITTAATGDAGSVLADTTNDEADLRMIPATANAQTWAFVFMYEII